jgi:hypothetical protein
MSKQIKIKLTQEIANKNKKYITSTILLKKEQNHNLFLRNKGCIYYFFSYQYLNHEIKVLVSLLTKKLKIANKYNKT